MDRHPHHQHGDHRRGDHEHGWSPADGRGLRVVRALATVTFVVTAVFAFALFYAGLDAWSELSSLPTTGAEAHVYWVFAGLWVPLAVLAAGVVTMAVWSVAVDGAVRWTGYRTLRLAGLACTGFCLLGVVGTAITAPSPVLAYAWSALVAMALTLGACGVQLVGARLLVPTDLRRPAGAALR